MNSGQCFSFLLSTQDQTKFFDWLIWAQLIWINNYSSHRNLAVVLLAGQPHVTQYSCFPKHHYPHKEVTFLMFILPSTLLLFYHGQTSYSFQFLGGKIKILTLCPDCNPEQASPACEPAAQYCHVCLTGASQLQFAPSRSVGVQLQTSAPGHCGDWKREQTFGRGKGKDRNTGIGHSMVSVIAGESRHQSFLQFLPTGDDTTLR